MIEFWDKFLVSCHPDIVFISMSMMLMLQTLTSPKSAAAPLSRAPGPGWTGKPVQQGTTTAERNVMQFFFYILILLFIDAFWLYFFFNLTQWQFTDTNKNLVYVKLLQFTKHGLSTVEAQSWGFYKHAQPQPKKGVAYKTKNVYLSWTREIRTVNWFKNRLTNRDSHTATQILPL